MKQFYRNLVQIGRHEDNDAQEELDNERLHLRPQNTPTKTMTVTENSVTVSLLYQSQARTLINLFPSINEPDIGPAEWSDPKELSKGIRTTPDSYEHQSKDSRLGNFIVTSEHRC